MIFLEKCVFLELPKTGSTYARYILINLPDSKYKTIGKKHNVYNSLSNELKREFDNKRIVSSIRNPFDWYVSLYAFACEHRGGLYTKTQKRPDLLSVSNPFEFFKVCINHMRNRKKWQSVFTDVNNKENFKKFLYLLLIEDSLGVGNRYELDGFNKKIGYYSYDFLRMTTKNFDSLKDKNLGYSDILDHYQKNNIVDITLRNESLRKDLIKFSTDLCSGPKEMESSINSKPKKSRTATKRKPYKYYYTEELIELIREKEKIILESFNYDFED